MCNALVYNEHNLEPFIGHSDIEYPLAVQLGGNDPEILSTAASLCEQYGAFEEINLNCGCPSTKAKKAGFGAELMLDPTETGKLLHAMKRRLARTTLSVKCRIGVTGRESREDLIEFIRSVSDAGVRKVVLHARSCVLRGLTPAQNRTVPPLDYDRVFDMVKVFPEMEFTLNGGVSTLDDAVEHLKHVHGVMIGRAAYDCPFLFATADEVFYGASSAGKKTRRDILHAYLDYANESREQGLFGSGIPNLIKPLHHFFNDHPSKKLYKLQLDTLVKESVRRKLDLDEIVWTSIENSIPPEYLDAPIRSSR